MQHHLPDRPGIDLNAETRREERGECHRQRNFDHSL